MVGNFRIPNTESVFSKEAREKRQRISRENICGNVYAAHDGAEPTG